MNIFRNKINKSKIKIPSIIYKSHEIQNTFFFFKCTIFNLNAWNVIFK